MGAAEGGWIEKVVIRGVRERLLLLCVSGYVGKTGWKGNFVLEILTGIMNVCWKSESGRRGRKYVGNVECFWGVGCRRKLHELL